MKKFVKKKFFFKAIFLHSLTYKYHIVSNNKIHRPSFKLLFILFMVFKCVLNNLFPNLGINLGKTVELVHAKV